MGIIVTLLPSPARLQRLHAAVRDRHTVAPCSGWAEVTRVCETQPVHLAVLDLYADGALNFERVRLLQDRFPRIALLAYVTVTAERARDLFDAGRVGIDGLVVADLDDSPVVLSGVIDKAEARSAAGRVAPSVAGFKPVVRDAVLAAVTRAHERLTPDALTRVLAVPRRALARRLAEAGLPAPHRLIMWGRLIVAAHMLEDRERTADSVAIALDFTSGSAFRNTCQRYLRATPRQIRARGGADFAVRAFLAQMELAAAGGEPAGSRTSHRSPPLAV